MSDIVYFCSRHFLRSWHVIFVSGYYSCSFALSSLCNFVDHAVHCDWQMLIICCSVWLVTGSCRTCCLLQRVYV